MAAVLITLREPTADASFAAILARKRFGIAMAAMIKTNGSMSAPKYPRTSPAMAIPSPFSLPVDFLISESER